MSLPQQIGIVGGGLLGLSLADRLLKAGHRVTVLESAPHFGGLASAWKLGDITWDRFYHVILLSDSYTHELLKNIGLADEFVGVTTRTGFYSDGKLHSLSTSLDFLRFKPLGLWSKYRLGRTILHASKLTDWKPLERILVEDWLVSLSGRKTYEKIWRPLLRSKLGESYKESSAAFMWATIQRMYAARRSGMKRELFGYVHGGYARIVEELTKHLAQRGCELRTNAGVESIGSIPGCRPHVQLKSGESLEFDRVICTASAPLVPRLIPMLTQDEIDRWNRLKYQGIVCASVLLKQPLANYYVTNITEEWVPFTGVIEMTALVDPAHLNGHHLVYLPKYAAPDDPIMKESDTSIRERFLSALEKMYPHFTRDQVLEFQIARAKYVFPIPQLGYSELVPRMHTTLPGVSVVNSAHITNGTLNVNETLMLAERALKELRIQTPDLIPAGVS